MQNMATAISDYIDKYEINTTVTLVNNNLKHRLNYFINVSITSVLIHK